MTSNEYARIREEIQARLEDAVALDNRARDTQLPDAVGSSAEGEVRVTLDHRGFISQVVFSPDINLLDRDELRARTLAALQAARSELAAAGPTSDPDAILRDTSILDALGALTARQKGRD